MLATIEFMEYIERLIEPQIRSLLNKEESVLLLGPRQTGKTTMMERMKSDLVISLIHAKTRQLYESDPGILEKRVSEIYTQKNRPVVFIDEVQKVPSLMDTIQYLIDSKRAVFLLTGSSARKLRRGKNVNMLPGRVFTVRMDPLVIGEGHSQSLEDILIYGSLPGVIGKKDAGDREHILSSYVTAYLEEEVRAEALARNLSAFGKFLSLAASESGSLINFSKLSQEIGISHTTIRDYYEILDDCLIVERIDPIRKSQSNRRLTKAQKFLFFDLGVRRLASEEGVHPSREMFGRLFEQFVGLELLRFARLENPRMHIRYWRDNNGPEIDWVIDDGSEWVPVEVKWTETPRERDMKHIRLFLNEESRAKRGYIICRTPDILDFGGGVKAVPWMDIKKIFIKHS